MHLGTLDVCFIPQGLRIWVVFLERWVDFVINRDVEKRLQLWRYRYESGEHVVYIAIGCKGILIVYIHFGAVSPWSNLLQLFCAKLGH